MGLSWQRVSGGSIGVRGLSAGARAIGQAGKLIVLVAIAGALFGLVIVYGNGLRDPRYLDGWILAVGFVAQLGFHVAIKSRRLSPRWAWRWRKLHIYLGYILIAAFISHSDFSLPDTGFEWALWAGFVLISVSGPIGVYLSWSIKAKERIDASLSYAGIPERGAELARQVHALVKNTDPTAATFGLPGLPHDAWIADLYTKSLQEFFQVPRNTASHLIGSQRPLKVLLTEIDGLWRYVDKQSQDKLIAIKSLVIEKDNLDFARVYLWLNQAWLFVHVPMTYALCVLAVFHVVVVYAFSSGAW